MSISGRISTLVILCFSCLASLNARSVSAQLIFEGSVFHEATNAGLTNNNDQGGALFMFVRNSGTTPQTFTNGTVSFNGQAVGSHSNYDWSRTWPVTVQPGEVATLTIKGNGGVFAPGQTANVTLTSDSGVSVVGSNLALSTPKLRVGNVIPSQDLTKSYVYLRNDDTSPYQIDRLFLNDDVTAHSRFVGGSTSIAPGDVKIIEVDHGQAQSLMTPYAVRVEATRTANATNVLTGAPVRLTEPILPTGSWHADLHQRETDMESARLQYGHQIHGATSRFQRLQDSRTEKYSIRGINIDVLDFPENNGSFDLDTVEFRDFSTGVAGGVPFQAPLFELPGPVADQADNPAIYGWYLRDEPDLQTNASHRNPQAMWRLNETYWRNSEKPTFINLVSDRSVQRYGLIADHPAIDRYMQFAPLADNNSGPRNIDQTLKYADSMKNNVEPLRMWWTTQGVSEGTWSNQPTDWGIDVQFWASIMGGAKGIVGFMYNDVSQNFPTQHARQVDLMHQLQTVRNLVLYGEPVANTTIRVNGNLVDQSANNIDAAARSIISEHAVVLPVGNFTGTQTFFGGASFDVLNDVTVDVTIPDWISIDQVRRVTTDGYIDDVAYSQNGQQITLSIPSLNDTDVFVIGEQDALAPAQVDNLRLAPRDPTDPFYEPAPAGRQLLSWDEPFDNFGVFGYEVWEDDGLLGSSKTPAYEVLDFDPAAAYRVRAYDASGNVGEFSLDLTTIGSTWNGDDPTAGLAGDGISWGDPLNWTRDGVVDAAFVPGDRVVLGSGSSSSVIQLGENRTVTTLEFRDDYTLQGNILQVDAGEVTVASGVTGTVTSRLSSGIPIEKRGPGTLLISGFADNVEVVSGTFGGVGRPMSVSVGPGGTFAPGLPSGVMLITTDLQMQPLSRFEVKIVDANQFGSVTTLGDAIVNGSLVVDLSVGNYQPQVGDSFAIVTALDTLTGVFDESELGIPAFGFGWEVIYDFAGDQIRLEVTNRSDFDENGLLDCDDLDALLAAVVTGSSDPMFDVNGDGAIDEMDYQDWVTEVKGTLLGDANLDFVVDGQDFIIWNNNKFTNGHGWCSGNFNADLVVDGQDFIIWNNNKFKSAAPFLVPEPQLGLWLVGWVWMMFRRLPPVFSREPTR